MAEICSRITSLGTPRGGELAWLWGIINIVLPGIGVIIAGLLDGNTTDIIIGVLQFLLAFIFIGWVWAIIWGLLMIARGCGAA